MAYDYFSSKGIDSCNKFFSSSIDGLDKKIDIVCSWDKFA